MSMVPLILFQCDGCKGLSQRPVEDKLPPGWSEHKAGAVSHLCSNCGTEVSRAIAVLLGVAKRMGWSVEDLVGEFEMETPRWSQ